MGARQHAARQVMKTIRIRRFLPVIMATVTLVASAVWAAEAPPTIQWQKSFGGTEGDELAALRQTRDGGYILGGTSRSGVSGNKTSANYGGSDFWVLKLDADGNKFWENSFGGSDEDYLSSVQQASDGGYIVGGTSFSDVSG